jgi:hypothetical protein
VEAVLDGEGQSTGTQFAPFLECVIWELVPATHEYETYRPTSPTDLRTNAGIGSDAKTCTPW